MDIELIKLLQQTGFTEKEARVYLALLELGRADVTDIAKIAELKRSIVYVLVDGLIEKGYITSIPGCKVSIYQATDPGLIHNQIKTTTKHLGEMLPFLRSLQNKGEKKPKMHFFETKEGILNIYYSLNNLHDQFYISSYERLERIFPGEVDKWIKNYKKNKYTFVGRHLLPNNPREIEFAKKLLPINQEIRVMPDITKMGLDFSVCGNQVVITSFDEKPYLILIESEDMAKSIMSIFEIAWRNGKEIS